MIEQAIHNMLASPIEDEMRGQLHGMARSWTPICLAPVIRMTYFELFLCLVEKINLKVMNRANQGQY
jgi:hypothetical protein